MRKIPYGSLAFHQHAESLSPQFDCQPFAIGFGSDAESPRNKRTTNAYRNEADFLFHYTSKGCGILYDEQNNEYRVPSGSAFMVPIPSATEYSNPGPDDWESMWVFFNGQLATDLAQTLIQKNGNYVFHQDANGVSVQALYKLFRLRHAGDLHPAQSSAALFEILQGLNYQAETQVPEKIRAACRFVNQNLGNQNLNVALIAQTIQLSRFHFSREFNKYMHCSPNNYIIEQRLHKAVDLILSQQYKMKDIAMMGGFNEAAYFNAVFKKKYGYPPGKMGSHLR